MLHYQTLQKDLAQAMVMNVKNISRNELGHTVPSIEVGAQLANKLEVSLDFSAGLEQVGKEPELEALFKKFWKLEENGKEQRKEVGSVLASGTELSIFVLGLLIKLKSAMKEVKLKIPEEKLGFFRELVKQLGFEMEEGNEESDEEAIEIPEEHKAIVRERIKKSDQDPERLLEWDQVKDGFKYD